MAEEDLVKKINRAKELLATVRNAAMATVNEDGSPHNTPFRFFYDPALEYVYWGSHRASIHSANVLRTGKIFVVLFDAMQPGGLYIKAKEGHMLSGGELHKALDVHNAARKKEGKDPIGFDYYEGVSPQRMWSARITNLWVNLVERDANGNVIKDDRKEVAAKDLL